MTTPQDVSSRSGPRAMAAVRAAGVRVVVWGGLACVVLWYSGSLRGLFTPSASPRPVEPTAESELEDGLAWPHLRGPAYGGVSEETGLADSWPRGGPPLVWKREIGRGDSGLIAVGQRVAAVAGQVQVSRLPQRQGPRISVRPAGLRGVHPVVSLVAGRPRCLCSTKSC